MKKPKYTEAWCDPDCPFLKPSEDDSVDGKCLKYNFDLYWYDYYLRVCDGAYLGELKEVPENEQDSR